jgi:DNA-binding transcriptional MocR family regulator
MTNDLTKLPQHIDEVRASLTETFRNEQSLVKSLGDELNHLDQQLLQSVRQVAADHQIRRGTILNALEDLADSIGMFQTQHKDALPKPVAVSQPTAGPPTAAAIPEQVDYGYQYSPPAGDWRQATKNLSLEDELELHLNGLNGKSSQH